MCLNATYSRFRVGKLLPDTFPIKDGLKQGHALSPLLFNFALDYAIIRVQVNRDGLKLNGSHQVWVCADNVKIVGGSVHTKKKNAEALVVASKETELEVNTDRTKYMVMSRDQNAGQNQNMYINRKGGRVQIFGINLNYQIPPPNATTCSYELRGFFPPGCGYSVADF